MKIKAVLLLSLLISAQVLACGGDKDDDDKGVRSQIQIIDK